MSARLTRITRWKSPHTELSKCHPICWDPELGPCHTEQFTGNQFQVISKKKGCSHLNVYNTFLRARNTLFGKLLKNNGLVVCTAVGCLQISWKSCRGYCIMITSWCKMITSWDDFVSGWRNPQMSSSSYLNYLGWNIIDIESNWTAQASLGEN